MSLPILSRRHPVWVMWFEGVSSYCCFCFVVSHKTFAFMLGLILTLALKQLRLWSIVDKFDPKVTKLNRIYVNNYLRLAVRLFNLRFVIVTICYQINYQATRPEGKLPVRQCILVSTIFRLTHKLRKWYIWFREKSVY